MDFAARLVPLFTLLAASFCVPAQAEDAPAQAGDIPAQAIDYEVGSSLVCDTQEQVERFLAVFSGDAHAAIRVVNAEQQNPSACAIMNIAFVRGNQLGSVHRGDGAFQITHILVIGVENENGIQPVKPAAYFSAFGVKEYAV
jgi:hypothetical protein